MVYSARDLFYGIDGNDEKFPSSEAVLLILLKGQNRNGRTAERIGKIGRIRNLGNLGKDFH